MAYFKQKYILKYFLSRGFSIVKEGDLFTVLRPNKVHKFPSDYTLSIPNNEHEQGFDSYILGMLRDYGEIVNHENNYDDFKTLFSDNNSIIKFRFFDNDNIEGTMPLLKHIEALEAFKKTLTQSVIFETTRKPIFANAKTEVDEYLRKCKAMQTEMGSFVSKFEIPNENIGDLHTKVDTEQVNNRLFDVLNFVKEEIIVAEPKRVINRTIDENYIEKYSNYINIELLQSIRDIYSKTKINNIEYTLTTVRYSKKISTEKAQQRIIAFNSYIRDVKNILIKSVPLEIVGKVKRLFSDAPQTSNQNVITITGEISNEIKNIKLTLKSEQYLEALEAHKNEKQIRIKGLATESKSEWIVKQVDDFEII